MTSIVITGNFRALQVELNNLQLKMKREIRKSLYESAKIVKANIKTVMREPKSGAFKPKSSLRFKASPIRRSIVGEGLARDTGRAESRIANTNPQNNSIEVGFKKENSFDYVKYWEFNGRPTLSISGGRSLRDIKSIFERNLKIDK